MFHSAFRAPRIKPFRKPRRPPDTSVANARFFARNSRLLLLSAHVPRPQLPFLLVQHSQKSQWRLLTTQRREYIREQAWLFTRTSVITWTVLLSLTLMGGVVVQELLERDHPTPREWRTYTRIIYRNIEGHQKEGVNPTGATDWVLIGELSRRLLSRLEHEDYDGQDLLEQDSDRVDVPGAGRTGFDLRKKSEAWRQGYYEVLTSCAKAAEHLDSKLWDRTTGMVFPKRYVIGPSNPNALRLPPWVSYTPLEENCEPPSPPPEHYYAQILTSKGFTPKQRLDTAIAYAEWLDFKGLHNTAEEMLALARDIAESASRAQPVYDASHRVNERTTSLVSENQLAASTALATHHASAGNTSKALSLYLSILQQRRAAPAVAALPSAPTKTYPAPATDLEAMSQWYHKFLDMMQEPPYPLADAAKYDEPLVKRDGDGSTCEEAKLETYIGEVLFATASTEKGRADAIRWTKDAFEKAGPLITGKGVSDETRLQCLSCTEVGLDNWLTMARRMADNEREGKLADRSRSSEWVPSSWKGRLGHGAASTKQDDEVARGRWELEETEALKRVKQFQHQDLRHKLTTSVWTPFWARAKDLMKC